MFLFFYLASSHAINSSNETHLFILISLEKIFFFFSIIMYPDVLALLESNHVFDPFLIYIFFYFYPSTGTYFR